MEYNKDTIKKELLHIEENFEWSDECTPELVDEILVKNYVDMVDDGVLVLTEIGERFLKGKKSNYLKENYYEDLENNNDIIDEIKKEFKIHASK